MTSDRQNDASTVVKESGAFARMLDATHAMSTVWVGFPVTNYFYNRRHILRDRAKLMKVQYLPQDQIRHIQTEALRSRLHYAAKYIPFYQKRFREVDFNPRDFKRPEDIARLPSLTREDVSEHYREMVDYRLADSVRKADERGGAAAGQPLPLARLRRHRLIKHTSSGSTGSPVSFYQDGSITAASWTFDGLYKSWFDVPRGAREVRVARLSTELLRGGAVQRLRGLVWRQRLLPGLNLTESDYAYAYSFLNAYRPRVLWGFTSALTGLAEYINANDDRRLGFRPKVVVTWAEPLLEEDENVMERAYGCPITNLYGSHEVGHVACRCPQGSFHIDQLHQYVESVESNGASAGQELLITPLFASPMPFIRYQMGDLGEVEESACDCGRTLQVLSKLEGRTYELYETPDGKMISPNFWLHIFRREHLAGFIRRFQVTYRPGGNITVDIVTKSEADMSTEGELRALVESNLGSGTSVKWRYVDRIQPQPSGKVPIVKREE